MTLAAGTAGAGAMVAGRDAAVTFMVTVPVAASAPSLAVMAALPAFTAVTTPRASTVATIGSEEVKVKYTGATGVRLSEAPLTENTAEVPVTAVVAPTILETVWFAIAALEAATTLPRFSYWMSLSQTVLPEGVL